MANLHPNIGTWLSSDQVIYNQLAKFHDIALECSRFFILDGHIIRVSLGNRSFVTNWGVREDTAEILTIIQTGFAP